VPRGVIIGRVDMVGCVERFDSPWFVGRYGFVLRNPVPCQPCPWRGMPGLFDVPDEVVKQLGLGGKS